MGLLIVFIIVSVIYSIFKPQIKGFLGEKSVQFMLSGLDENEYFILNDIYIPKEGGGTTQLDHVLISLYGIFVIETKNYKGWIFGSEDAQYWTQTIYKNKNKFYNPIKQNKNHIKALKKLIGDSYPIFSIVVFTCDCELKKINTHTPVVYTVKLKREIQKHTEKLITVDDFQKIKLQLIEFNDTDKEVKKEHIKSIRNKTNEVKNKVKDNICPWCNSKLVERSGKYGKFKGCSSYPKCKYILKS